MRTSVKTATNKSQLYGASRNNRRNDSLSFNDKRSSTAQLKKIQESAHAKQNAPIQREEARPLVDMLTDRIGAGHSHSVKNREFVLGKVGTDKAYKKAYRSARDNNLGLNVIPDSWKQPFRDAVPATINLIAQVVKEVSHIGDEQEAANTFHDRFFNNMFRQNDTESKVARYAYYKVSDSTAAKQYMKTFQHEDQKFNLGLDFRQNEDDKSVQYETPKESLFGPSQTSLDIGTQIANRVLREAFDSGSQEGAFFRIAAAISSTMDSSNDSLRIASKILDDYLKPKLMNFIYRIPLGEQEDDGNVWEGQTLNSNVQNENGNQLSDNDSVRTNIRAAWQQIREVVSPAVLNHSGKVGIMIDGLFSRPFYRDSEKMIHMGRVTGSKATVMHEFGHHLEDTANPPHWIKLQQLMRERAKGVQLKSIFPFTIPGVISKDEMRYDTDLPASGEMGGYFGYNVKYYESGSTEVVSTAFEVFHNREKAYRIAVKDPGMFLAVMGVLRGR